MKKNRAAALTTASTLMIGAGWAAGMIGSAINSSNNTNLINSPSTKNTVPATTPAATSSTSTSSNASASAAPSTSSAPAAVNGTFDGQLVNTAQGPFQTEIIVKDGKITKVNILVGGDSRGTSQEINNYALPQLQKMILTAQSWNVQIISGASYTSQGVIESTKAAMSKAGLA